MRCVPAICCALTDTRLTSGTFTDPSMTPQLPSLDPGTHGTDGLVLLTTCGRGCRSVTRHRPLCNVLRTVSEVDSCIIRVWGGPHLSSIACVTSPGSSELQLPASPCPVRGVWLLALGLTPCRAADALSAGLLGTRHGQMAVMTTPVQRSAGCCNAYSDMLPCCQ
jgi:hypothetical protein